MGSREEAVMFAAELRRSGREFSPVPYAYTAYEGDPNELPGMTLPEGIGGLPETTLRFVRPVDPAEGEPKDDQEFGRAIHHVDFVEVTPPLPENVSFTLHTLSRTKSRNNGEGSFLLTADREGSTVIARHVDAGNVAAYPINRTPRIKEIEVLNRYTNVLASVAAMVTEAALVTANQRSVR